LVDVVDQGLGAGTFNVHAAPCEPQPNLNDTLVAVLHVHRTGVAREVLVDPLHDFLRGLRCRVDLLPNVGEPVLFVGINVRELVDDLTVDDGEIRHAFRRVDELRPHHVGLVEMFFEVDP
jgi:hypothetical protein